LINFALNEVERRLKVESPRSRPYLLYLEATNACNFSCPYCPTGKRFGRRTGMTDPAALAELIKELKDSVFMATLHGWGEPLLFPDLAALVDLLHRNRIFTQLSTNVSLLTGDRAVELFNAGLDHLILAVDGTSEESYSQYRKGGRLDEIMAKMRGAVAAKKETGAATIIEWQFVVFKHNEHEIEQARRMAKEIGVDRIDLVPAYVSEDNPEDASTRESFRSRLSPLERHADCYSLWTTLTVLENGDVAACCWDYYGDSGFGNVFRESFRDVWTNEKFRSSRRLIRLGPDRAKTDTVCMLCVRNISKRSPAQAKRGAEVRAHAGG
jgi:MoaA/NifB/PqqE/SkfB family radical SAM enzyme